MSWMQYLAVSRSFSSMEDRPSPFRMRQQHLLPKFGEGLDGAGAGGSTHAAGDGARGAGQSCSVEKGSTMEVGTNTVQIPTSPPRHAYPGGRWRIRRSPVAEPTPPREPRLVQSELRLETVKVVRNDLTDSDLLLVPARPASERSVRSSKPERRKAASVRWWTRLLGLFTGF